MTHGENVPYKLTLGEGVQPIDVAWLHVTKLPKDRFKDLTGEEYPQPTSDNFPRPNWISLQFTALAERESAILVDVNKPQLQAHTVFLDRVRGNLVNAGLDETEVEHLVNVFALGILVGTKAVEVTEQYAEQGIKDIEG